MSTRPDRRWLVQEKQSQPSFLRTARLDGTSFVTTSYDWDGQTLSFVTDPIEQDEFLDQVRQGFSIEPHLQFALQWLGSKAGNCIDVGANIGTFALPLAVRGSTVLAIEALPKNFILLSLAAAENGSGRLIPVHAALGESNGTASMSGTSAWGQPTFLVWKFHH